jgi:membrane protein implicated in regulation of membrane protease activity
MFLHRIGCFFLLVGGGLILLFAASDASLQTDYNFLFWAVICILVGYGLWRRFRPGRERARRFRLLRKTGSNEEGIPPETE